MPCPATRVASFSSASCAAPELLVLGRQVLALVDAVTTSSNRSKGDMDPTPYRPPNQTYRCTYSQMWVAMKSSCGLTVRRDEKDALARVLQNRDHRAGTRRMPAAALEAEVDQYIADLVGERDEQGAGWWSATVATVPGGSPRLPE